MSELEIALDEGALWLTLNRPEQLNALTGEMVIALVEELRGAVARDDVRLVVLTGAGPAFSAGADLGGDNAQENYDAASVDGANMLIRAITELDKPVVCALNGIAAGVGMSVALACDLVVATESAALTLAFTKIGLMPDGGASALIAAAVGRIRAMRMALMAERISAADAFGWGLVTAVYPVDQFDVEVSSVISTLLSGPAVALRKTKNAINTATLVELEAALEREKQGQLALIDSNDFREGTRAFQQRRAAKFTDS